MNEEKRTEYHCFVCKRHSTPDGEWVYGEENENLYTSGVYHAHCGLEYIRKFVPYEDQECIQNELIVRINEVEKEMKERRKKELMRK